MNIDHPVVTTPPEGIDAADACCRCNPDGPTDGPAGFPSQAEATITLTATQITDLAELLDEIDEFLRMGHHSIDALTEYYRTRHDDCHPRFTALCLLDSVSFTALCLRRQAQVAVNQTARDQEAADQ